MDFIDNIQVLIVEDEKQVREVLKIKLNKLGYSLHIYESGNLEEAISILSQNPKIDIIFLDMNLRGEKGMQLYDYVNLESQAVIFSTAYQEFAIRAIQKRAVGYILKPFIDEELAIAMQNAIVFLEVRALNKLSNENKDKPAEHILTVSHGNKKVLIKYSDINFIEASDKYCFIHRNDDQKFLSSNNLGHYTKILEPYGFIQCHKSYVVNKKYIDTIEKTTLTLKCGKSIPVSRRKKSIVLKNLN